MIIPPVFVESRLPDSLITRFGIVWVGLLEVNRIDHDPAPVDRHLDRLSLAHVEGIPSVLAMLNAHQGYKLSDRIRRNLP